MAQSKRHYRVAERTKELETQDALLTRDYLREMSFLSGMIYLCSILLSFSVGYLLGKHN
ncbi:MAG: hypothetical protein RR448_08400 [Niameybacter sp.]|uniref:hypothetical protein n=1 Tax=Niameybacter sp. TaxID=2033640 RepID=UPI002FC9A81B